MRVGLAGFTSLSLPGLLQLRAQAAGVATDSGRPAGVAGDNGKAVILVWLRGGMSHLDTYDPKPSAPREYRGPYRTIGTNIPGLHLTELVPLHAKIADRFTIVRSMAHTGGGHPSGSLQMLTGDLDRGDKPKPVLPDWMTVANYLKMDASKPMPNYMGVNGVTRYDNFKIAGPGYLDPSYGPFMVSGNPNAPDFRVPGVGVDDAEGGLVSRRVSLKQRLDRLARAADVTGEMQAIDGFEAQAMNLMTSPQVRDAFDLSRESDHVRERYGRNRWGQQCLMARRLVEAGVQIITTTFDGPPAGSVHNWDDHAVNNHVFDALSYRMPTYDRALTALIEDVYNRGLDKKVLVVVTGEFGRTPRISEAPSAEGGVTSAPKGVRQPGRDHWPSAFSNLWAGGGIETGGVIGRTDPRGEYVADDRVTAQDFLATIYHHLGIDAARIMLPDLSGRPIPILHDGRPVPALMG